MLYRIFFITEVAEVKVVHADNVSEAVAKASEIEQGDDGYEGIEDFSDESIIYVDSKEFVGYYEAAQDGVEEKNEKLLSAIYGDKEDADSDDGDEPE
jgi:hypothetical protein